MKQLASFLLLGCAVAGHSLYAQEMLSDRWKETRRLDLDQKPVSYSDTLRLSGITKESMNLRKGAFQYKGNIYNDVLDLGAVTYGIMKNTKEEIRLQDEENIHIFTREIKDRSAEDAAAKKAGIDIPPDPVAEISLSLIRGNWSVYKRGSRNGPLAKVDYKTLISSITVDTAATGNKGKIMAGGSEPLYIIISFSGSDIIAEDKDKKTHMLKVWRLNDEELVFEDENNIAYFLKRFR